jgi:hypothetical protein
VTSTLGKNRCQRNHHTRGGDMNKKLRPLAALAMIALIGAGCSNGR